MSEKKTCGPDAGQEKRRDQGKCCPPSPEKNAEKSCCSTAERSGSQCGPSQEPPSEDCCPPQDTQAQSCCPPAVDCNATGGEFPGYRLLPFVEGWIDEVPCVATRLQWSDRFGHWAMRWGFGRDHFAVTPGLYAVGRPTDHSPVLVSANYKMSFDLLRRELDGIDAWIMVIDTKGINVWCAAGKGTFGTDEIVRRAERVDLAGRVSHRRLIVPQLGAPGVAAHEVKKKSGFTVIYGPVRAADIPAFLEADLQASAAMRQVTFSAGERFILTPVELTGMLRYLLWAAAILLILGGIGEGGYSLANALSRGGTAILAVITGLLAGAVLTPVLLPWLPGRAFSLKGALSGAAVGITIAVFFAETFWTLDTAALLLAVGAVSSYSAMNFTGSTTYTSPSGVEKEMRRAIPCQLAAVAGAAIAWFGAAF